MWYTLARGEMFSRDMYLSESRLYLENNNMKEALRALGLYLQENKQDARGWTLLGRVGLALDDLQLASVSLNRAYKIGKQTDIGILKLLLETARDPVRANLLTNNKADFDLLFSQYANAIENNTHFIALSPAPENLVAVAEALSKLFPGDAEHYKEVADHAYKHALEVRSEQKGRPAGVLW